jgi:hypothetical protein
MATSARRAPLTYRAYRFPHRRGRLIRRWHAQGRVAGFASLGIAGVVSGVGYLGNLLPLGTSGTLAAAGTIGVLNDITALAVAAAFALFLSEFLEEIALGE